MSDSKGSGKAVITVESFPNGSIHSITLGSGEISIFQIIAALEIEKKKLVEMLLGKDPGREGPQFNVKHL